MNTITKILIVEDESIAAYNIEAILESFGYVVTGTVTTGREVMEHVKENRPDVVLMDIVLEGEMDGIEVAGKVQKIFDVPVVYMTGCADEETLERAKETEPFGYVVKPFGEREVHAAIQMALYRHKTEAELRKYRERLEELVNSRTSQLKNANDRFEKELHYRRTAQEDLFSHHVRLKKVLMETVSVLSDAGERLGLHAPGHPRRVAKLAAAVASDMGASSEVVDGIHIMGLLHDIGKIVVPPQPFRKAGPLTGEEIELVRLHPRAGYDMVCSIPFSWPVADVILQHHERINRSGYPAGIGGGDIFFEAKIIAIAEVVDTMATRQRYRPAFGMNEALDEILKNRGTLYDNEAVDACVKLFTEKKFSLT